MTADRTIFVSLASYRDEFLPYTIRSVLDGARHPENLRFGISWQRDEDESLAPWRDDPRFRIREHPYAHSRGYGWSRADAQALYRGEQYHLLIDSHSHLARDWDVSLIEQLESKPSAKPLLTTSSPPFTFDAQGRVRLPWIGTDHDGVPTMSCSQDSPAGFLNLKMSSARAPGPNTPACFVCCNFLFTHGRWIEEVPEDPDMINACHESALSVRSYTHGYDMFVPDAVQVWHLDYRNYARGRRNVWESADPGWVARQTVRMLAKLDVLIYGVGDPAILGKHGNGTARTREQWVALAGITDDKSKLPRALTAAPRAGVLGHLRRLLDARR